QGDFAPERSDIDLQAVVQSPLTENELRSAEQVIRGKRFPSLPKRPRSVWAVNIRNCLGDPRYPGTLARADKGIPKTLPRIVLSLKALPAPSVFHRFRPSTT